MARIGYDAAVEALDTSYRGVTRVVVDLADDDFLRPTRCVGWSVMDLLQHQLLDAQRALVALATPSTSDPDVDHVSYWGGFSADTDSARSHSRFVRVMAAAYASPRGLLARWRSTSTAAVRAAQRADPSGHVATQGHVLTVPDLLVTLVVESAIHHLDLVLDLPDATGPGPGPLGLVRTTLDGLLGRPEPVGWDDPTYALKGGGRLPLDEEERGTLGALAERFPLIR